MGMKAGNRQQATGNSKKVNMSVTIAGIKMENPVMAASGTFGYAEEFEKFFDLNKLGAIVTKTITLQPRTGNPPLRIVETPSGMLNTVGLQNPGLDDFVKLKLPFFKRVKSPLIVSIAGTTADEFVRLAQNLSREKIVKGLELNISCPNIKYDAKEKNEEDTALWKQSRMFCQDEKDTYELVKSVRRSTRLPLIVKLSPNVTDVAEIALAAEDAGADALSLVNTFYGMAVDIETQKPKLSTIHGGLSGPAIKPAALYMVFRVAHAVKIPVIGIGGIMTAEDAIEFLLCGAKAVQVGTANFVNPRACVEIIDGIEKYLKKKKIKNIRDLKMSSD